MGPRDQLVALGALLNPVLFPPETGDEGATPADYQFCQSSTVDCRYSRLSRRLVTDPHDRPMLMRP